MSQRNEIERYKFYRLDPRSSLAGNMASTIINMSTFLCILSVFLISLCIYRIEAADDGPVDAQIKVGDVDVTADDAQVEYAKGSVCGYCKYCKVRTIYSCFCDASPRISYQGCMVTILATLHRSYKRLILA
jgi:hypothetical protein